jgi:hypothetical protein
LRAIRPALGLSTCELAIGGDRCRFEARLSGNSSGGVGTLCVWARGSLGVIETRCF